MIKIIHYREKCIGCNSCVEHAPTHWKISKADGKSCCVGSHQKQENIFVREIEDWEFEANTRAARDCPVGIIKIEKTKK